MFATIGALDVLMRQMNDLKDKPLKYCDDASIIARLQARIDEEDPCLGVAGEDEFKNKGVTYCATCDGPLFRGKKVAVVGGGNSAVQTAIEMADIATSVSLIVRSTIRADPVYVAMLKPRKNITVHLNTTVTALRGDKFLTSVSIKDSSGRIQDIGIDGIFIEIGWLPNTENLDGFVDLNAQKEIIIDCNGHTSRPGVFAAGDVTSVKSKQIIIAAGEGAKAALEAHEYLMKLKPEL
jgi:alkyl hydroperoxide reductase subunit F